MSFWEIVQLGLILCAINWLVKLIVIGISKVLSEVLDYVREVREIDKANKQRVKQEEQGTREIFIGQNGQVKGLR